MDGKPAECSRARMIGTGMVVCAYGLVIGLQFIESQVASPRSPDQTNIAREANSLAPPRLKPVPPRQYPLTLANDPDVYQSGVINAFHQEWDRSESESPREQIPFRRTTTHAHNQ